MMEFSKLLLNEMEKLYKKKRLAAIILILLVLIPIFIYAQDAQMKQREERLGTNDWRIVLQQSIIDSQNRLQSSGIPEEWKKQLTIMIDQQQYYLDNDINPNSPGAPTFVREFLSEGIAMFIPLLVMIIAIDLVSGERSDGTIKILLTRPIKRWKILLSKYVTLLLAVSLIIFLVLILSYLLAGMFFHFDGLKIPVATGFAIENGALVTESIKLVPQWQYILMIAGLAWFVGVVTGTISFMVSVLVHNTSIGMGIMFAALIAGAILKGFASAWAGAKYIFSVNLDLTDYLSGNLPMVEGLTLDFSIMILAIWGIAALCVAFLVFTRQDMFS